MSISRGGNGFALLTSYRKGNISIFLFLSVWEKCVWLDTQSETSKSFDGESLGERERERRKENIHNGGLGRENA